MQRLLLLGLNHTTAPLSVREKLAFNAAQRQAALAAFRARFPACEVVLLSTCNRVELYICREKHGRPRVEDFAEFLATFHNLPLGELRPHLYEKTSREMVTHLFSVSASLDSMVLGESQILGQVRDAYDAAKVAGGVGPRLNPLLQRAIAVGKQVMSETPLGEGRLSIAGVAVDHASQIFERFDDKCVLSIGAGEMSALVLRHFVALKPGRLLICNRTLEKAQALADEFGGQAVPLDRLAEHLETVDIVLTGTGSPEPIITRSMFAAVHKKRRYRPVFLIDIALPRDIEAGVGELENVYLYNLDDLQLVVAQTQAQRSQTIEQARGLVVTAVDEYLRSHRVREMGPLIDRLYKRYHQLAAEELARTLHKLPNIQLAEKAHLEELTRRIVNKLLHDPVQAMRSTGEQTDNASQINAMEKLFRLTETEPGTEPPEKPENPPV